MTGFIFINDEYLSNSFRYNYTSFHFSNDRAKVFQCDNDDFSYSNSNTVHEGIKWGYIDNIGNQIIPFSYDIAADFQEDFAVVGVFLGTIENKIKSNDSIDIYVDEEQIVKYGFINKYGDLVISFQYDSAASFSEGMACVSKGNKFGFINVFGIETISCKYDYAESF